MLKKQNKINIENIQTQIQHVHNHHTANSIYFTQNKQSQYIIKDRNNTHTKDPQSTKCRLGKLPKIIYHYLFFCIIKNKMNKIHTKYRKKSKKKK